MEIFSFVAVTYCMFLTHLHVDYTEGAELVDSVLDVVRKEAEGTDALQGKLIRVVCLRYIRASRVRFGC